MTTNITKTETATRVVIGAAMIGAPLVSVAAPITLALAGTYFIFTAMLRRDPVYAVAERLTTSERKPRQEFANNRAYA